MWNVRPENKSTLLRANAIAWFRTRSFANPIFIVSINNNNKRNGGVLRGFDAREKKQKIPKIWNEWN